MRSSTAVVALGLTAVLPARAMGQEASSSAEEPATRAETELSFTAADTGLQIRIVDGSPGRVPDRDCRTPCRFRVPNGHYVIAAGTYEFEVGANGGTQHWEVEDDSGHLLALGIIGILLGGGGIGVGAWGLSELLPQDDPSSEWLAAASVATGLGGAIFVAGIVAAALYPGTAELRSYAPTIGESATLSPSLALFRDAEGGPGCGLSLSLRL
ncbi:MAG: hypothetical protein JXB32_03970 [Deltaproteobacteria bacterium]|nr:hypothetical protein [Deltaproteobacteria bacterium]